MVRWAEAATGRVAAAPFWGKFLQTLRCGASLTRYGTAEGPGCVHPGKIGSYLADGDGDRVPLLIVERERLVVPLLIGRLFRQVVSPDVQPPVSEAIHVRVVVTVHGVDLGHASPPIPVPGCTSI